MQEGLVFKRTVFSMLKGIIGAPFAGFVVVIVASFFNLGETTLFLLGAAGAVIILYITIVGENIRVEVDLRELRYYKGSKLKESYVLENIGVGYYSRVERGLMGNENLLLKVRKFDTQDETSLDCSPLGQKQFYKLFEYLEAHTPAKDDEVLTEE